MKYSVLSMRSKQFLVAEGDKVYVGGSNFTPDEAKILLHFDGEKLSLGKPHLEISGLKLKVLQNEVKGDKIKVFKYKAKSRYRKTIGSRPRYCEVLVEKLP